MATCGVSARDRYLTAFRHEEPDRVPLDLATSEGFRFPGEAWRRGPLERLEAQRRAGADPCLDIWLPEPAFHPDVRVRRGTAGHDEQGCPLLYAEYDTPAGTLRQLVRESADWCNAKEHQLMQLRTLGDSVRDNWEVQLFDDWNAPRYVEAPIRTAADLEALQYLLRVPTGDALAQWRKEAETVKQWAAEQQVLLRARRTFGAEAGMWLMKWEGFLCATVQEPELVQELCRIVGEWQLARAELALDMGVDVLMHRGYYETPEYFSPENYERFCRPLLVRLGTTARQAGARFALQRSQGNTRQVELLKQLPIDILYDVEPGIGGEDLGLLKRELRGLTTLWGGIDSTLVINRGTAADVERAVRDAIGFCAEGGGFVVMPIAWIEPGTKPERVAAAAAAVNRYGRYAKPCPA